MLRRTGQRVLYGNSLFTTGLVSFGPVLTLPNLVWLLRANRLFLRTLGARLQKERSSLTFSTAPVLINPILEHAGEAMAVCSNLMSGKIKTELEFMHCVQCQGFFWFDQPTLTKLNPLSLRSTVGVC